MSDSESDSDDNNRKYQQIPLSLKRNVVRTPFGGTSIPYNGGFIVRSNLDCIFGNYANFA